MCIPARRIGVILFATLFFSYSYVHQDKFKTEIPVSRLDLLHAVWSQRTFQIDAYHTNTPDKAVHEGHYYCDKAPGVFILALPAFSLATGWLAWQGIPLDSDAGWLISSWVTCAGSLAVITALGGVALFAWLCQWVQPRRAYIATLALFLGTAAFPYCTLLMSHAAVIGLLTISLWASDCGIPERGRSRIFDGRDMLAGCSAGLALSCEYSAGIAVVGILACPLVSKPKRIVSILLGLVPPLMLIPAYHWVCFGDPFTIAYNHEAVFTQMHENFFGIKFPPSGENIVSLLLSARRGLFIWSPVLLLALVGCFSLYRVSRGLFWVTYAVSIVQVLLIGGYYTLYAGGSYGPRFLAPLLPLLALPTAFGIARFSRTGLVLATISVLMTSLTVVVSIFIPPRYDNPLWEFYVPAFLQPSLSPNLGSVLGLSGHISLLPLVLGVSLGISLGWRLMPGDKPKPDRTMG